MIKKFEQFNVDDPYGEEIWDDKRDEIINEIKNLMESWGPDLTMEDLAIDGEMPEPITFHDENIEDDEIHVIDILYEDAIGARVCGGPGYKESRSKVDIEYEDLTIDVLKKILELLHNWLESEPEG